MRDSQLCGFHILNPMIWWTFALAYRTVGIKAGSCIIRNLGGIRHVLFWIISSRIWVMWAVFQSNAVVLKAQHWWSMELSEVLIKQTDFMGFIAKMSCFCFCFLNKDVFHLATSGMRSLYCTVLVKHPVSSLQGTESQKFKPFLAIQFKLEDPFALLSHYVHRGSVPLQLGLLRVLRSAWLRSALKCKTNLYELNIQLILFLLEHAAFISNVKFPLAFVTCDRIFPRNRAWAWQLGRLRVQGVGWGSFCHYKGGLSLLRRLASRGLREETLNRRSSYLAPAFRSLDCFGHLLINP